MDQQTMMSYAPFIDYGSQPSYPGYHPSMIPMVPPFPFPGTPPARLNMMPDTTFKSGSELGDTPPSSGSGSSTQTKKKFKSPEEESRYRTKRARNNEAAKKSRKSRKEKENSLMAQVKELSQELLVHRQQRAMDDLEKEQLRGIISGQGQKISQLEAELAHFRESYNNENMNPAYQADVKPSSFGMFNQ